MERDQVLCPPDRNKWISQWSKNMKSNTIGTIWVKLMILAITISALLFGWNLWREQQQRINDAKISFSIDLQDNVSTPKLLDYVKVSIGINGETLLRQKIKVRLNGIDSSVEKRQELFYTTSYKYTFGRVAIAPQYVFELVLSDGTIKHMTTVDNIDRIINVDTDITLNLENRYARLDRDFILQWRNIDKGYNIDFSARYPDGHNGYDRVPLVETNRAEGKYIVPHQKFVSEHGQIKYLQLSIIRDRSDFSVGEYFDNRSDINYSSFYSKTINFAR